MFEVLYDPYKYTTIGLLALFTSFPFPIQCIEIINGYLTG